MGGGKIVNEAKASPAVIHYIGPVKPWSALSVHPQRKRWWRTLKKTPFRDYKPADGSLKNRLRQCYLLVTKSIERQFTLESKRRIGKLIPSSLKNGLKKSMMKSTKN